MSTEYDEEFEQVDAGASETYPVSAGDIKQGGFMVFNGRPGKVVSYSTSKTGKHGHAKANITGIDIFNKKKYEDCLPASHGCAVPYIKRSEWQLIALDEEGFMTLMDTKGNCRSDLKLPDETEEDEELSKKVKTLIEESKEVLVTVLSAMSIEKVVEAKEV
jgi:translation initiation factor 5A